MGKIDFVLPWVDGSDSEWQEEKSKYNSTSNIETNIQARFRDMGTLKYVLRSIELHCPWYNKIYIITTGHYPDWLNIEHENIVLVTHKELYFDTKHLPVFSSSSIEMNLSNIKGLSEKFVYLNDDTIIMRRINISRFFVDNKPVDFLSHGWIPRNNLFFRLKGEDTWVHSLNNNLKLINNHFFPMQFAFNNLYHISYNLKTKISNFLLAKFYKKIIWLEHWHHPQAYLKQSLTEVSNIFREEMMDCSSNRFRKNNDLTAYLYRYWQLASENFYPYKYNDGYDADIVNYAYLKNAIVEIEENKGINFVCFNDQMFQVADEEFIKSKELLLDYLNNIFKEKSSFEKEIS